MTNGGYSLAEKAVRPLAWLLVRTPVMGRVLASEGLEHAFRKATTEARERGQHILAAKSSKRSDGDAA